MVICDLGDQKLLITWKISPPSSEEAAWCPGAAVSTTPEGIGFMHTQTRRTAEVRNVRRSRPTVKHLAPITDRYRTWYRFRGRWYEGGRFGAVESRRELPGEESYRRFSPPSLGWDACSRLLILDQCTRWSRLDWRWMVGY